MHEHAHVVRAFDDVAARRTELAEQPAQVARPHVLDDDIAVRRGRRDHVRARLDVIGGDVVRRAVQQPAAALDDDELGAHTGDVRTHADQAPRQVVHMRLARGVADHGDALGEHRRHHQVLGAGDRGHVERDARAVQAAGAGDISALTFLDLGAHEPEALEMLLHAAHADVIAAGLGDARLPRPRHQRAEQQERAAHAPAEPGVHLGGAELCRVQPPRVRVGMRDLDPHVLEHPGHRRDVLDIGHVAELDLLVGEQRRRHDRQRRVLASGDRDAPLEPSPATDAQEFHLRLPYPTARADRVVPDRVD